MIEYDRGVGAHPVFLCSYLPERKILDGISFAVPAGKSVAIVGTSGSGNHSFLSLDKLYYVVVIKILGFDDILIYLLKVNKGVF